MSLADNILATAKNLESLAHEIEETKNNSERYEEFTNIFLLNPSTDTLKIIEASGGIVIKESGELNKEYSGIHVLVHKDWIISSKFKIFKSYEHKTSFLSLIPKSFRDNKIEIQILLIIPNHQGKNPKVIYTELDNENYCEALNQRAAKTKCITLDLNLIDKIKRLKEYYGNDKCVDAL